MNDVSNDVSDVPGFPVVAQIGVNSGPIGGITVTAGGTRIMVTNCCADSVSTIDTAANAVDSTISGTAEPFAVVSAGKERAYVNIASAAYDGVAVIDLRANAVAAVHPVAFSVSDLAVSRDGRRVYCSRVQAGRADIAVLDAATGETIEIAAVPGTTADKVRISPDGQRLYVASHGPSSDQLVVIDTRERQVVGSIEIGAPIRDVALSPGGDAVYVVSCSPDFGAVLDVIDTHTDTITSTVKVTGPGGFVTQLALSREGDRVYLVSDLGVTVLSTSTQNVIGTITTGSAPSCVVENLDGSRLYIADFSGVLTVVSIASPNVRTDDDDITAGNEWAWGMSDLFDRVPAMV